MSLLSPIFAYAFLALIPLGAVYFLKVRPRRRETSAYFLWEKVFTGKKSSALFQRLRDVWSLLLMALAFAAVAFALCGPEFSRDDRKDLLLVIDQSASMQAQGRLAAAKDQASGIIRALNGSQRAAVAVMAADLQFLSHLTDDPRELLDAIEKIQPTDLPLRLDSLKAFRAGQSGDWARQHRLIFLSDGNTTEPLPEGVELAKVGAPAENAGIIAADLQYAPGSTDQMLFYFQTASSFKGPVKADLILQAIGGAVGKFIPLDLVPGVNPPQTFTVENAAPGRWEARLEIKDALAADNVVSLVAARPKPVRVAVRTEDRYFMENSVLAFARGGGVLELVTESPQIVLTRSTTPDAPLALIFQPEGESPWWKSPGVPLDPAAVVPKVLQPEHPVLRFIDAASLNFAGARQLQAPEGALVLVSTEDGVPLIHLASSGGKSALVINMDPAAADFYLSAWFPALVFSAATHLAAREEELAAVYPAGARIPVPGVHDGQPSTITTPAGAVEKIQSPHFGPLATTGFYALENTSGKWNAAAALLNTDESLLDNAKVPNTALSLAQGIPPAVLFTLLAILVLVAESLLYHRRKVG